MTGRRIGGARSCAAAASLMTVVVVVVAAMTATILFAAPAFADENAATEGCVYGNWSAPGECGAVAGECLAPVYRTGVPETSNSNGTTMAAAENITCVTLTNYVPCNDAECAADFCTLTEWSEWGPCSATCGDNSSRVRSRSVEVAVNITCEHLAGEVLVQWEPCNLPDCPTPELLIDNGDLTLAVPAGNDIVFKTGTRRESLADIKGGFASSISLLESEQSSMIATLEDDWEDDLIALRGEVNNAKMEAIRDAKVYTDGVASHLNISIAMQKGHLDSQINGIRSELLSELADTTELIGIRLNSSHSIHVGTNEEQAIQIDGLISLTSILQDDVAALDENKADAEDVGGLVGALSNDIDAVHESFEAEISDLRAALVPEKPPKPSLTDLWATKISLTWPESPSPTPIVGFVVEYTVGDDTDTAEVEGRSFTIETAPSTEYAFRVRAVNGFGPGPFSDTFTVSTPESSAFAKRYFCQPSGWGVTIGGTPVTACRITFTTSVRAIAHATFSGHARCNSDWIYGAISFDGDTPTPSRQESAPAHSYTTTWETFGSDRAVVVDPGEHTVDMRFYAGSTAYFNGGSMHLQVIAAPIADHAFVKSCITSTGWSYSVSYPNTARPCAVSAEAGVRSVLWGSFAGHWYSNVNWVYAAVAINNDLSGSSVSDQNFSPAHSYSTGWEVVRGTRVDTIDSGGYSMAPSVWKGSDGTAGFNGMGFSSFAIPVGDNNAGSFRCTPGTWSYASSNNVITPCTATINLPARSVVYGYMGGHMRISSGTCYGVVSFDNDGEGALGEYGSRLQPMAAGHSYSTQWESFNTGRSIVLDAGSHTVSIQFRCQSYGWYNGAGLQGYWVREGSF